MVTVINRVGLVSGGIHKNTGRAVELIIACAGSTENFPARTGKRRVSGHGIKQYYTIVTRIRDIYLV